MDKIKVGSGGNQRGEKNHMFSHGKSNSTEYRRWRGMKARCMNINSPDYENYGGRGITIHGEWIDSFDKYDKYINELPNALKHGYTIDRIDNNKNYEHGNLRWASQRTQSRNTQKSVFNKFTEEELSDLAEMRDNLGMTMEEAGKIAGITRTQFMDVYHNKYYDREKAYTHKRR